MLRNRALYGCGCLPVHLPGDTSPPRPSEQPGRLPWLRLHAPGRSDVDFLPPHPDHPERLHRGHRRSIL